MSNPKHAEKQGRGEMCGQAGRVTRHLATSGTQPCFLGLKDTSTDLYRGRVYG
jgi:hypothetical protein